MYDYNNVFAKIIRQEIVCKKIHEGEHFLSFYDMYPKVPIHAIVIPKGNFQNIYDFTNQATSEQITDFWQGVNQTIDILKIENGYRIITNTGKNSHQSVMHFHVHIMAGVDLSDKAAS